jgi:hypothetical protein
LANIRSPLNGEYYTEEGRRNFEAEVTRFIDLYPGALVRPGEKFDFERFYALDAIKNGKDTSRFDSSYISELRDKLEQSTK